MDLQGAGLAQHPDERALGVAADDRIVHHHEALAADDFLERVELEPDTELADRLRRLDEGAADVGVLHQTLAVRNARTLRVTDRGGGAGFGDRDDQVALGGVLAGEATADLDAGGVHRTAGDDTVRTGQVHVLEHAALGLGVREAGGADAVGVDGEQFAGLDVADEGRADDVECGGLTGDDPAAVQAAEAQRADAVRVAGRVERVLVHEGEAERAAQRRQQLHGRLLDGAVGGGVREEGADDVGVGRRRRRGACR